MFMFLKLNVESRHSTYIMYTCVCVLVVSTLLCDGPELFVAARLYQDDWRPFGPPRFI